MKYCFSSFNVTEPGSLIFRHLHITTEITHYHLLKTQKDYYHLFFLVVNVSVIFNTLYLTQLDNVISDPV